MSSRSVRSRHGFVADRRPPSRFIWLAASDGYCVDLGEKNQRALATSADATVVGLIDCRAAFARDVVPTADRAACLEGRLT